MHSKKSKRTQKLNSPHFTLTFDAIGTTWNIDLPSNCSIDQQILSDKILGRIQEFDKNYSRFREDSLIYNIYQSPETYKLPGDAYSMLTLYKKLYQLSGGSFTPLIGTLLDQVGYDKDYSFLKKDIHALPKLEDTLSYTSQEIIVKTNILLDFGACGKGYLVDMIGKLLENEGIKSFCIDASGDILIKSDQAMRVGLEHPENPNQVIGVTTILNQSICASAGNRRTWKDFHHIIDPHTRTSPKHILATWVIADTAMIADALATCLFLTKPEILQKEFSFEYLILNSNFTAQKSDNFHAELYYN